ncbi:uncharacterized protein TRIADDRAFT_53557 [Trichoplax adhaerens]|uniref:FYVE-type domain-containing protein n=1 Tax=Trichoplax adhaerens TaxID=10228 RepID=B3RPI7_TRIAD|nr:hypothetical protein TRIADDRAFT_53557 [Trichoplax adhaerens]EDV27644.1 hypothetical protein TRIADDRAFT_53557 [Trichoplax adhaerens]|eukprot:XP_002109478.1 hypothetical protein TRIADDRAFT_53557 [Trichoplax adhaerens]
MAEMQDTTNHPSPDDENGHLGNSTNNNVAQQIDQDQVENLIDLCQKMAQCTASLAVKIEKIPKIEKNQLPPALDKSRYLNTVWNNLTKIYHKQQLLVKNVSKLLANNPDYSDDVPNDQDNKITNPPNHQKLPMTESEIKTERNHQQVNTNIIMDDIRKNLLAYLQKNNLQCHIDDLTHHLNLSQPMQDLITETCDLRNQIKEVETKYDNSQATIDDLQLELEKLKNSVESEASALRFEASSDALEKQTALDTINRYEKEKHHLLEVIEQYECNMQEMNSHMQYQNGEIASMKENYDTEISRLQKQLRETKEEAINMEDELLQVTRGRDRERANGVNLKIEFGDFKERSILSEKRLCEALEQLRHEKFTLKEKLMSLNRENSNLLRKLDSSKQQTKIAEKWVKDSEVARCMQCSSQFSVLLRRHHCRICGKIFCHSCSDYWIETPHDRKPLRSCQKCYKNYLGEPPETEKLNVSDVITIPCDPEKDLSKEKRYRLIANSRGQLIYESESDAEDDADLTSSNGIVFTTNQYTLTDKQDQFDDATSDRTAECKTHPMNKQIEIGANECFRIPLNITSNRTLKWNFLTEQALVPAAVTNSHINMMTGTVNAFRPGMYILEFKNDSQRNSCCQIELNLK